MNNGPGPKRIQHSFKRLPIASHSVVESKQRRRRVRTAVRKPLGAAPSSNRARMIMLQILRDIG
jgi:hypothetical protein